MRILFFGSYDAGRHPRVSVLREGFVSRGDEVEECNVPLGDTTAGRVAALSHPWLALPLIGRIVHSWWLLIRRSRGVTTPQVVVVGYMGHFDVHLARRLWPTATIVLDQLAFAADTAADRRRGGRATRAVLAWLDRRAISAADRVAVDVEGNAALLPPSQRHKAVVTWVGASSAWFHPPRERPDRSLSVVFFGMFTPLQGAPVIGRAIDLLTGHDIEFTLVGTGQDRDATRRACAGNPRVRWIDWVEPARLPELVSSHDVCLGIFGAGAKALRVVPNKVFQGAAAGCAVVTSDTAAQRAALAGAARFVPPGDAAALAAALAALEGSAQELWNARRAAYERADRAFHGHEVVLPLRQALLEAMP